MRTILVTGGASGIGKATVELLGSRGDKVISVDLANADINADLATDEGRATLVAEAEKLSGGQLDAVVANAGLSAPSPATIAVNFFGMTATVVGLRPLLAKSPNPRAVVTASMASLLPSDEKLVELQLAGDEAGALARAAELAADAEAGGLIYSSSKQAAARWLRRNAPTAQWAGAGIALNGVAPGVISTPMTAELIATDEAKEALLQMVPMPLNGVAEPEVVAQVIGWLTSPENTHLCGQVIFVDGGSDVVMRGDNVW